MEVEADLNNPVNFSLDVPVFSSGDPENSALSFQVQPKSSMNVPVQFVPSTLGAANHQAKRKLILRQLISDFENLLICIIFLLTSICASIILKTSCAVFFPKI